MKQADSLFFPEAAQQGLKSKTVIGSAIAGATQAVRIGVGLATVPLMARLLDPSDFGLFAIVAVLTNFALMFVDAGLSLATVQRDNVSQQQVCNLFWISFGLGIAIAGMVSVAAPALAWAYDEPRLMWLTIACSTTYVFTGLTIQHQALLRRNMMFGRIAWVEIISMVAGQAVAIAWAWGFFAESLDYWALALVPIVTTLARMICVWIACRWIPGRYVASEKIGEMLGFGGNLTFGLIFNYIGNMADVLAVGYFFGDTALGKYERSSMLSVQPTRQLNGPLSSVCVPALSRLKDSPEKYKAAFRTATAMLAMVIMPIAAVCIVDADLVIGLMLGKGWEDAIPVFQILSVMMLTLPFCNASAWLLISQGRGVETRRFQMFDASIKLVLIAIAIPWGVVGVAIACLTRAVVMPPLLFRMIGRKGSVRSAHLWSFLAVQLLAFSLAAMLLWLLRQQGELFDSVGLSIVMACVLSALGSTSVMVSFRTIRRGILDVASVFATAKSPAKTTAS